MKVLFLHTNAPDYLASGLFHGLRSVLGKDCLDLPRYDSMYKPLTDVIRSKLRGNGFSLYGLLEDIPSLSEERFFIWSSNIKDYDLYIIADIWQMWDTYKRLLKLVPPHKIIVIDPIDTPRIFPFNDYLTILKKNPFKLLDSIHSTTKYFKRELGCSMQDYIGLSRLLPANLLRQIVPRNIYPIGFSIPEEKIIRVLPETKSQLFVSNIVDHEVHQHRPDSFFTELGKANYKFDKEDEYYADIQASKFGVTIKRAGWDCLRHYEYAANGTVLCFKDLDKKPLQNAPHGLNKDNCIIYSSYSNLVEQIDRLSPDDYKRLLNNTYIWAMENSTVRLAKRVLKVATT